MEKILKKQFMKFLRIEGYDFQDGKSTPNSQHRKSKNTSIHIIMQLQKPVIKRENKNRQQNSLHRKTTDQIFKKAN